MTQLATRFNRLWCSTLIDVLQDGSRVHPQQTAGAAGRNSIELIGGRLNVPMAYPVLNVSARRMGYAFLCAEAAWILQGDNRVATIAPYAKKIADYSDDGVTFFGAYGPPLRDQLPYVWQTLGRDPSSRQAVATIWRPRPGASKDVPCTLSAQWLIRPDYATGRPLLHCVLTMRSWDLWLGVPYDVFNFSCLSAYVGARLLQLGFPSQLELGTLVATAGSLHLYESEEARAKELACGSLPAEDFVLADPLRPADWADDPDELTAHLWRRADLGGGWPEDNLSSSQRTYPLPRWLHELPPHQPHLYRGGPDATA